MNPINANDKMDVEGSNQSININTYINFNEGAISVKNINIGLSPDLNLTPNPSRVREGNYMDKGNNSLIGVVSILTTFQNTCISTLETEREYIE